MALNSSQPMGCELLADADTSLAAQCASTDADGCTGDRVIAQDAGTKGTCSTADKGALTVVLDKASRQSG